MRNIEDITLKDGRNLKDVLELHKKWLEDKKDGKRANLSYEDLSNVDFSNLNLRCIFLKGANLEGANFKGADLAYADLTDANLTDAILIRTYLRGANLTNTILIRANLNIAELSIANLTDAILIRANLEGANLTNAILIRANLTYSNLKGVNLSIANLESAVLAYAILIDVNLENANLTGANLKGVILKGINLTGANLKDIKYNNIASFFAPQCPEKGSFIGYKKANGKIVELLITEDAKRSSATTRKCRCSKAKVLSITSIDGKKNFKKVASDYDSNFIYEVGKIVQVKEFDDNRWNEDTDGIYFFITRDEAVMYRNEQIKRFKGYKINE